MWLFAPIDLDPYFGYHCIDTSFHPSLLVKKISPPKNPDTYFNNERYLVAV